MRVPLSWLADLVDLPAGLTAEALSARLTALGLKLEAIEHLGEDMGGPLVVGRVSSVDDEPQRNGKVVRWCQVDVGAANGTGEPQGIVCGAHNFAVGDLVVVVLPGGVLPGGFEISARKTYGHVSAGMICSARELGLGADHEGILVLPPGTGEPGDDAFDVLPLREDVIELEINPDRSYALSLRGVARESALGLGLPFRDPADARPPAVTPEVADHPVVVADPDRCPVFVTRSVSGLDPTAPTPGWMARRLQLAGMRSISLAVDVTNYVMLELGNPIHGYDARSLSGPIVVRRARAGERLTTLDGVDRVLDAEDLLITDDSGPIGLAGVMGGESTELSTGTTSVVVEAAHFTPTGIFRTARRHKLPTEGSRRWERGVDPALPGAAADRVVGLLLTYGGGSASPGTTTGPGAPEPVTVEIDADLPARVTGMDIPAETTVANLRAVGCAVEEISGGRLRATVPSWRPDVTDPFDLVEEVARVVGYDRVPSVLPPAPSGRGLRPEQLLRRRVGRTLAGAGYVETVSFPFLGTADLDRLGLPGDDDRRDLLRLANPLSAEEPHLTTTLLPGLLRAAARNLGRGTPDVALFETATVTRPRGAVAAPILPVDRRPTAAEWDQLQQALPDQPLHLALVLAGHRERPGWWGEGRAASWADAIHGVREVVQALGLEAEVSASTRAPWHPGRCAEVRVSGRSVGWAGELHPRVCAGHALPPRTAVAEVNLGLLLDLAPDVVPAPVLSGFPVAKEDVALVVDSAVPAANVAAALRAGAGPLCESVRLFDVFTGPQVGEGHRSLAFALRFRAPDRTLTDAETAMARDDAVRRAGDEVGAVQRA